MGRRGSALHGQRIESGDECEAHSVKTEHGRDSLEQGAGSAAVWAVLPHDRVGCVGELVAWYVALSMMTLMMMIQKRYCCND